MNRKMTLSICAALCLSLAVAQPAWRPNLGVAVEPGLSAEAYHARALSLVQQADARYEPDFFDQPGWREALAYADAAQRAEPTNPAYLRTLAYAYTKTQFWIQGYNAWKGLEGLGAVAPEDARWAALSAARVGYLRLLDGQPQEARPFLADSLRWQSRPEVQALLQRTQAEAVGE